MNPNFIIGGVILTIILFLSGYGYFEHNRYVTTKLEYDGFVSKAQMLAAQQLADNVRKEKEYADKIHAAESARDVAFDKLRYEQERARISRVSVTPQSSGGKLCFKRSKFDSALQQFLASVEGLLTEGDNALIDNQTLLKAWPQ